MIQSSFHNFSHRLQWYHIIYRLHKLQAVINKIERPLINSKIYTNPQKPKFVLVSFRQEKQNYRCKTSWLPPLESTSKDICHDANSGYKTWIINCRVKDQPFMTSPNRIGRCIMINLQRTNITFPMAPSLFYLLMLS